MNATEREASLKSWTVCRSSVSRPLEVSAARCAAAIAGSAAAWGGAASGGALEGDSARCIPVETTRPRTMPRARLTKKKTRDLRMEAP